MVIQQATQMACSTHIFSAPNKQWKTLVFYLLEACPASHDLFEKLLKSNLLADVIA